MFSSIDIPRVSLVVPGAHVCPDFVTTSFKRYLFIYLLSQVLQARAQLQNYFETQFTDIVCERANFKFQFLM